MASIMNDVLTQMAESDYPYLYHINPVATAVSDYLRQKGYETLAEAITPINAHFVDEKMLQELAQVKAT